VVWVGVRGGLVPRKQRSSGEASGAAKKESRRDIGTPTPPQASKCRLVDSRVSTSAPPVHVASPRGNEDDRKQIILCFAAACCACFHLRAVLPCYNTVLCSECEREGRGLQNLVKH